MSYVVIADSHTLCREALCDYIRHADPDVIIEGIGDYIGLKEFISGGGPPDLVLIDKDLHGYNEDVFNEDISGLSIQPKIAMIVSLFNGTVSFDPSVHGIFSKSLSCKAFLTGVQEILSGRTFFPTFDDSIRVENYGVPIPRMPRDFELTTREKEVLTHLVKGASNKEIARALDLQVVTIKLHVRGICRKMKAGNRTQAALIAKENGWG